jgi:hypothetical protein
MTAAHSLPLLICGVVFGLLGACLASDWHGWTTRFRHYTFKQSSRQTKLLRGSYDAPVISYRIVGGFFLVVGVVMNLSAALGPR